MTLTDLYTQATEAGEAGCYTARHALPDGAILFCHIARVAGRSIVRRHLRTEFCVQAAGEKYSRTISRAAAALLLKQESAS